MVDVVKTRSGCEARKVGTKQCITAGTRRSGHEHGGGAHEGARYTDAYVMLKRFWMHAWLLSDFLISV